jgi:hypothetical protein
MIYYYFFRGKKNYNYLFLSMWKLTLGYGIMNWHPGMFLPGLEEKRIYATYFPLVMSLMQEDSPSEANNNNKKTITRSSSFLGYNSNRVLNAPREWLRLPSLDFLPPHVYDVLAGTGGLLLVNGSSQQPSEEQLQQPPNTNNTSLPLLQPTSTSPVSCPIHYRFVSGLLH